MTPTLRAFLLLGACAAAFAGPPGCGASSGGAPPATPSSEASLTALSVSTGVLVPEFDPGTTTYGVGPAVLDPDVTVVATAADGGTIEVNGVPTPSGGPSAPIPLPHGVTPVTVEVTSADGSAVTTYVIVLDRAGVSAQEAYLKASNAGWNDYFGYAVAISGDTLVVGAPLEASGATGVNPGPAAEADNAVTQAGAAYVFVRTGSTWTQQAYLKASNTEAIDTFGTPVAISGDTIVVGAMGEDGDGSSEANNDVTEAGAVYVFVRSGTTWTQQAYVKASNPGPGDQFGSSLAIDGDTLAVGAVVEDGAGVGPNPGPAAEASDGALDAGAAYVFVRTGTTWTQQAYVKASNTAVSDGFGVSVALSGDTLAVGAHGEDSAATGVGGGIPAQASDAAPGAGAVYVFVRSGTTWTQQAYVKASNTDPNDMFGISVALSGDTLAVGAVGESSSVAGVNPGPAAEADDGTPSSGAAYVFVRSGTTWTQQAYLKGSNPYISAWFGFALSLEGDLLVVGSPNEPSGATGVNPGPAAEADATAGVAGAVFAYVRDGTTWTKHAYVKASNTDGEDRFGWSVRASGGMIVVGAYHESSSSSGVNPGPAAEADDSLLASGAAYVIR